MLIKKAQNWSNNWKEPNIWWTKIKVWNWHKMMKVFTNLVFPLLVFLQRIFNVESVIDDRQLSCTTLSSTMQVAFQKLIIWLSWTLCSLIDTSFHFVICLTKVSPSPEERISTVNRIKALLPSIVTNIKQDPKNLCKSVQDTHFIQRWNSE